MRFFVLSYEYDCLISLLSQIFREVDRQIKHIVAVYVCDDIWQFHHIGFAVCRNFNADADALFENKFHALLAYTMTEVDKFR